MLGRKVRDRSLGIIDTEATFIKHIIDAMWQHNNNNNNKGDNEKLGKRRYITANELVSGSRVIKKIKKRQKAANMRYNLVLGDYRRLRNFTDARDKIGYLS